MTCSSRESLRRSVIPSRRTTSPRRLRSSRLARQRSVRELRRVVSILREGYRRGTLAAVSLLRGETVSSSYVPPTPPQEQPQSGGLLGGVEQAVGDLTGGAV